MSAKKDKFPLIVLSGPTAIGKTKLSLELAHAVKGEIISADSRQFFKQLQIGTAKPSKEELLEVNHYFINTLNIWEGYNVGEFEKDALKLISTIHSKGKTPILCGGSSLYIQAVCQGLPHFPDIPDNIRKKWTDRYEAHGINYLHQQLERLDPEYFNAVDRSNPHRLLRALMVCDVGPHTFSFYRNQPVQVERPFRPIYILLEMDRAQLYERINERVEQMVRQGLEAEARQMLPYREQQALQTVGYSEWFDFFDGVIDRQTAIELIKRNTRRFAKRQLTWFRKETFWNRFPLAEQAKILDFILQELNP